MPVFDGIDAETGNQNTIIRDYDPGRPEEGTILVQGTSTHASIFELLPRLAEAGAIVPDSVVELYQEAPVDRSDPVCFGLQDVSGWTW